MFENETPVPVVTLTIQGMPRAVPISLDRPGQRSGAPDAFDLESVVLTAELTRRPSRPADHAAENQALVALAEQMAASRNVLQQLADTALSLCHAHSAGISLLAENEKRFYWPAIAGQWASHIGGGTPRDFGPCGTVLDRNAAMLFSHPERYFPYLASIEPRIEEGLLIPFNADGAPVGTLWIIAHDASRRFDAEDLRVMTNLTRFAAAAYQTLQAEDAAVDRETEFRALADNMSQFAWMADSSGWIYWYNQRWFDYTGTTLKEMQGWRWQKVHHPDHVGRVVQKIQHCFDTGEPWEDTFPLRSKDGEYRWFLSRALPIRNERGSVVRWFGTNTDITERLRAEEQRMLLVDELNHRVKNTLATVQGIAAQTLRMAGVDPNVRETFESRLIALSNAHDILTKESWEGAEIHDIVARTLEPHADPAKPRSTIDPTASYA
ncbi:MAG: HWE histidine kinase domain-containing protein [Methylocella sp.]